VVDFKANYDFMAGKDPRMVAWGLVSVGFEGSAGRSRLDLREASGESSLLNGFYGWERPYRWVQRDASLTLDAPTSSLAIEGFAPMNYINAANHIHQSSAPVDVLVNGVYCGTIEVSDMLKKSEIKIPAAILKGDPKSAIVRFKAHFDCKAGGDQSPDPRRIAWGLVSAGFE
jgi:hypothetical protein